MDIEKIDRAFQTSDNLPQDVVFHDCREKPFRGYGLYRFETENVFRRMPQEAADRVSPGVSELSRHTAGGRLRFRTDSHYLVIRAILADCAWMGHMPFLGSCGFSIYLVRDGKPVHFGSIIPAGVAAPEDRNRLEGVLALPGEGMKEVLIYFPLYSGVENLWIGLSRNAVIEAGAEYRYRKPVLYYGSSITQGGCASRPGNSYQGFLSRNLDCDYVNLGFSGNGKAEIPMAEYLAELDASVFVLDYDYNAPDPEYLEQTHGRLYDIYRKRRPEVPILMLSKPGFHPDAESMARREIIKRTYLRALEQGDEKVYYIDGETLYRGYGLSDGDCTVDCVHPNDLGFYRIAQRLEPLIKKCLEEAV